MTNSTTDYWSVNGVSLQTLGWGIDAPGGSLEAPPPPRGGDIGVAHRDGALHRARTPDPRTLTFPMYVLDCDAAGAGSGYLEANWAALRAAFYGTPNGQSVVAKRWGGGYYTAVSYCVYAGGLEYTSMGEQARRFAVDLTLSDPWFYSTEQTLGTFAVGTHDITDDVLGDVRSPRYTITYTGPLTNPTVTVKQSTTVLSTLTYTGDIASAKTLVVDWPDFTVSGTDTAASVEHITATSQPWVDLAPVATSVVIGGSGAGSVKLEYFPAWF